ncbi:MAG: RNA polymerase sigma factor [Bryobacterales bacterium]|jgi:RNA polymerase sigma-70 factor (ECF subfamily)|nr:RNA polymerase sigma factor [Bryobacterales bacterium]
MPAVPVAIIRSPSASERHSAHAGSCEQLAISYHKYAASVQRYAYSIVRNHAEAEDIAQECFVRLIQQVQAQVHVSRPLPWLMRVAHNLAMDAIARRPREKQVSLDAVETASAPGPGPEAALMELDRKQRLQRALGSLSAQELQCWLLRSEGLRYREIGDVLGIRTGSVSTFLVRAAEKLSSV